MRPLREWVFKRAVEQRRKVYYVSYGRNALLYFDIDLHHGFQTEADGEKAKDLLNRLFTKFFGDSVLFWCDSTRGLNGYLKACNDLLNFEAANAVFARLEHALQRFLAYCNTLADFEIKGRFGHLDGDEYIWKQYGKLPVHNRNWNFQKLEDFKNKGSVRVSKLAALCQCIEDQVPVEVLEQNKTQKKALGKTPFVKDGHLFVSPAIEESLRQRVGESWQYQFWYSEDRDGGVWIDVMHLQPDGSLLTGMELEQSRTQTVTNPVIETQKPIVQEQVVIKPAKAAKPMKVNLALDGLVSEPDSFERQRQALLRFARYLKRVPSLEEALEFIREKCLFTGEWNENASRRQNRVSSILNFISQTFDPNKCAKGSVNIGKYDAWAAKRFPNGVTGRRKDLTPDGEIIDCGQVIRVSPKFIGIFMAIAEFALVVNKNEDDTLPHRRAKEIWDALFAKGLISVRFCSKKWAVCREAMVRDDSIRITNREYGPGKAMEWDVGAFFPFTGLWKQSKNRSGSGPRTLRKRRRRTTQRHNTLLKMQPLNHVLSARLTAARPPPSSNSNGCESKTLKNGSNKVEGTQRVRISLKTASKHTKGMP